MVADLLHSMGMATPPQPAVRMSIPAQPQRQGQGGSSSSGRAAFAPPTPASAEPRQPAPAPLPPPPTPPVVKSAAEVEKLRADTCRKVRTGLNKVFTYSAACTSPFPLAGICVPCTGSHDVLTALSTDSHAHVHASLQECVLHASSDAAMHAPK